MRSAIDKARRIPVSWTTLAPTACAVHCVLTPVLVAVAPAIVYETTVEWALLGVTVALATFVLTNGLRAHGIARPALLTAAGVALWVVSLLEYLQPVPEDVTTPIAALTAAGGLLWNARLHPPGDSDACSCSKH